MMRTVFALCARNANGVHASQASRPRRVGSGSNDIGMNDRA
jgi:hypothetical protein